MSKLVAVSTELQDLSAGYWFEITVGGLDGMADARRTTITVPGKPGLTYGGGVAESMTVVLHGVVFGTAGGGDTARQSYLSRMTALLAIFNTTAAPFALTIHPDARGVGGQLGTGETATLNVIFDRLTGPPAVGDEYREIDLECRCIDDPPEWVIDAS